MGSNVLTLVTYGNLGRDEDSSTRFKKGVEEQRHRRRSLELDV